MEEKNLQQHINEVKEIVGQMQTLEDGSWKVESKDRKHVGRGATLPEALQNFKKNVHERETMG